MPTPRCHGSAQIRHRLWRYFAAALLRHDAPRAARCYVRGGKARAHARAMIFAAVLRQQAPRCREIAFTRHASYAQAPCTRAMRR